MPVCSPTPSSRHRRRRSSADPQSAPGYSSLAADYHWFLDDTQLRVGCDTPGVRMALRGLTPGARVLDAACGIGIDAIALARRGIDVTATDDSAEMLAEAAQRIQAAQLEHAPRLVHAAWADLGTTLETESFDAVVCVGSSLAHIDQIDDLTRVAAVFRSLLVPGGQLIVDTRDWEATATNAGSIEVEPRILERDGRRCVRTFRWGTPQPDGAIELEATLIFLDGDTTTSVVYRVRQRPFSRGDLRAALEVAGFTSIALDHIPGDDRYTATARRP